jgi:hypothetical protein
MRRRKRDGNHSPPQNNFNTGFRGNEVMDSQFLAPTKQR